MKILGNIDHVDVVQAFSDVVRGRKGGREWAMGRE